MRELKNFWIMVVLGSFIAMLFLAGSALNESVSVLLNRSFIPLGLMVAGYFGIRHCDACILMEDYRRRRRESIKRGY